MPLLHVTDAEFETLRTTLAALPMEVAAQRLIRDPLIVRVLEPSARAAMNRMHASLDYEEVVSRAFLRLDRFFKKPEGRNELQAVILDANEFKWLLRVLARRHCVYATLDLIREVRSRGRANSEIVELEAVVLPTGMTEDKVTEVIDAIRKHEWSDVEKAVVNCLLDQSSLSDLAQSSGYERNYLYQVSGRVQQVINFIISCFLG